MDLLKESEPIERELEKQLQKEIARIEFAKKHKTLEHFY